MAERSVKHKVASSVLHLVGLKVVYWVYQLVVLKVLPMVVAMVEQKAAKRVGRMDDHLVE